MVIEVKRSGGFAGITIHRRIDTATLPEAARKEMERLCAAAQARLPAPHRGADAFVYEVTIDGARYVAGDENPAWRALIERVFAGLELQ